MAARLCRFLKVDGFSDLDAAKQFWESDCRDLGAMRMWEVPLASRQKSYLDRRRSMRKPLIGDVFNGFQQRRVCSMPGKYTTPKK